jgi:hypothetical protein
MAQGCGLTVVFRLRGIYIIVAPGDFQMAAAPVHVDMLRAVLEQLPIPEGYNKLRDTLSRTQPERAPPKIKQSPENTAPIMRAE